MESPKTHFGGFPAGSGFDTYVDIVWLQGTVAVFSLNRSQPDVYQLNLSNEVAVFFLDG
jgi:hypothetical protein